MAKVFSDGDLIDAAFLNKVSASVTDGIGDKKTPGDVRVFIGAEKAGSSDSVQGNLNTHTADATIHFTAASLNLDSKLNVAEKGAISGVAPLDSNSLVPAAFLPASGGYDAVYDTQALMIAAGAGHLSGQRFIVTDDPTPTNNGEYTATIDAPTVIADYYFNSGEVAAHNHAATEVTQEAGGTVQDFIDGQPALSSAAFDDRYAGFLDTGIHELVAGDLNLRVTNQFVAFNTADSPNYPSDIPNNRYAWLRVMAQADGRIRQIVYRAGSNAEYYRFSIDSGASWSDWIRNNIAESTAYDNTTSALDATNVQDAIDETLTKIPSAGGDLQSDFSVQMIGSPSLQQDIATKASSEAVFTDRLLGYRTDGIFEVLNTGEDLDSYLLNGVYSLTQNAVNYPPDMASRGAFTVSALTSTFTLQTVRDSNGVVFNRYSTDSGATWTAWVEEGADKVLKAGDTMTGALILNDDATDAKGAVTKQQTLQRDNTGTITAQRIWSGTQTDYDALTPDSNTLYFISGV